MLGRPAVSPRHKRGTFSKSRKPGTEGWGVAFSTPGPGSAPVTGWRQVGLPVCAAGCVLPWLAAPSSMWVRSPPGVGGSGRSVDTGKHLRSRVFSPGADSASGRVSSGGDSGSGGRHRRCSRGLAALGRGAQAGAGGRVVDRKRTVPVMWPTPEPGPSMVASLG